MFKRIHYNSYIMLNKTSKSILIYINYYCYYYLYVVEHKQNYFYPFVIFNFFKNYVTI